MRRIASVWRKLARGPALCASLLVPLTAFADCPTRSYKNIEAEARDLLSKSPIVFTAEVVQTRLVGTLNDPDGPEFNDVYRVIDVIKGATPPLTTLKIGSIGDGDEPPATAGQANQYIKSRIGRKLIVLTRNYVDPIGRPALIAAGDCPALPHADTPRGEALVAALKQEMRLQHR